MTRPRWLVTGGAGLVGGRLIEALRDLGHAPRAFVHERPVPGVRDVVRGDLREAADCRAATRDIDVVAHCAAALDPVESEALADEVNRGATLALARAAREAGCRVFVFLSSQAAIGWREDAGLLDEDAACAPTTAYGRSKRAAERELLAEPLAPTRLVILRPPTVYGPGERRNFLALTRAVSTGVFPVPGRGDNRMSFCHVDNLVEAVRFVAREPRAEGVLHVADDPPVSLRRVARTLAEACGARPLPLPFPMPAARLTAGALELAAAPLGVRPPLDRARLRTLTSDCALDTRALRELGFEAPVGFAEGVRETVARYRAEGAL